ncbi:MAG: glycerate kinase, partial [Opitutus sp.]
AWSRITDLSGGVPAGFPPVRVACDVTNPLLGPNGCAAIYGPQKGLAAADLEQLETISARVARQLCAYCGQPASLMETAGAGAAGGIAFGLITALNAQLLPGFDMTSDWLNLTARIRLADVVITGEGRFDDSSAQGKGPGAILTLAAAHGRPAHVFAGLVTAAPHATARLHQITPAGWSREQALRETPRTLRSAVQTFFPANHES